MSTRSEMRALLHTHNKFTGVNDMCKISCIHRFSSLMKMVRISRLDKHQHHCASDGATDRSSTPPPGACSMRAPMAEGVRKSMAVPDTAASSPVGIAVSSTGVYRSLRNRDQATCGTHHLCDDTFAANTCSHEQYWNPHTVPFLHIRNVKWPLVVRERYRYLNNAKQNSTGPRATTTRVVPVRPRNCWSLANANTVCLCAITN